VRLSDHILNRDNKPWLLYGGAEKAEIVGVCGPVHFGCALAPHIPMSRDRCTWCGVKKLTRTGRHKIGRELREYLRTKVCHKCGVKG
jgi:hypothetical protein